MTNLRKAFLVSASLLAIAASTFAGEAPQKPHKPDLPIASNADVQKLISDFKTRRDALLAGRETLLDQLKTATADQKKAILAKLEAQQKDLIEAQRALGKQMRDEMRKLRESTPGPGSH